MSLRKILEPRMEHDLPSGLMLIQTRGPGPWSSACSPYQGKRVTENKHSNGDRSMTYLHGECSYRRADSSRRLNVGRAHVVNTPPARSSSGLSCLPRYTMRPSYAYGRKLKLKAQLESSLS
jgi:hypothetical protein